LVDGTFHAKALAREFRFAAGPEAEILSRNANAAANRFPKPPLTNAGVADQHPARGALRIPRSSIEPLPFSGAALRTSLLQLGANSFKFDERMKEAIKKEVPACSDQDKISSVFI